MTICANQLVVALAVKVKTFLALEFEGANANAGDAAIEGLLAVLNASRYLI